MTLRDPRYLLAAILPAVLVVATAGSANAAIVAQDSFQSYTAPGPLAGNNGGSGWAGAWGSAGGNPTVIDPATDLVANGNNGGNRAVQFAANNDNAAYRTLASAQSGDIFFSFLFRFDIGTGGSIGNNDFLALWFDNVTTGSHTGRPNIGLKSQEGPSDTDYFVRLSLGDEEYSTTQAVVGTTVQLVGRLFKDANANYNRMSLWVNPTNSDLGSPDATAMIGASISSFNTVGFRTTNLDSSDKLLVDQLVLGTDWQDVVVPEPSALVVWAFAMAAGVIGLRRRNARQASRTEA